MGVENPTTITNLALCLDSSQAFASPSDGNERGFQMEKQCAEILKSLPYVKEVVETQKYGELDHDMVDLIVIFGDDGCEAESSIKRLCVSEVFVQVKSSSRGEVHFKEELTKRLKGKGMQSDKEARQQWVLENKRILLNAGVRKSRSGRTVRLIAPGEIISDFESQLENINDYHRVQFSSPTSG